MTHSRVLLFPGPIEFSRDRRAKNALCRKKRWIWACSERNILIRQIATAFAAMDRSRIVGDTPSATRRRKSAPHVTVLVEGMEHAKNLQRMMPGWVALDAVPTPNETSGPDEPDPDPDEVHKEPNVIATLMYVASDGVSTDVLIRATGGRGSLNWNMIRGRNKTSTPTVIDIEDRFDSLAMSESESRLLDYAAQDFRLRKSKLPVS